MVRTLSANCIVFRLWVLCFAAMAGISADDFKTLDQLRKEAVKNAAEQPQSERGNSELKLTVAAPSAVSCPNPVALDLFRHQIAYQRTEGSDPLRGLAQVHADVWMCGPLTGFYVRESLNGFVPGVRMTYLFAEDGLRGGGTCPVERNWRECVEGFAGVEYAINLVKTCTATIDMHAIPSWEPSPNDERKRQVANELRREIEAKWQGAQEIVIRDFNLQDPQITIYVKMPDGDYFQGCSFHGTREPHCEGWHLFGQAPLSSIRKGIFDRPYRLK